MKNNIIATKLELFVDYECLGESKMGRDASCVNDSPQNEDLLTFLLRMVRPNLKRIDTRFGDDFNEFLENHSGYFLDCVYCKSGGAKGFIRFINSTDEELCIASFGKKIASFFLEHKNRSADLCFLCRSIEKDFDLAEGLDVFPLSVRIENMYEDGKYEVISPRGRMLVANINFPHSRL